MFLSCDLSVCWILNDWVFAFPWFLVWGAGGVYAGYELIMWYASVMNYSAIIVDKTLHGDSVSCRLETNGLMLSFVANRGHVGGVRGVGDRVATGKPISIAVKSLPIQLRRGLRSTRLYLVSLAKRETIDLAAYAEFEGEGVATDLTTGEILREGADNLNKSARLSWKDKVADWIMAGLGGGGAVAVVMLLMGFHK